MLYTVIICRRHGFSIHHFIAQADADAAFEAACADDLCYGATIYGPDGFINSYQMVTQPGGLHQPR